MKKEHIFILIATLVFTIAAGVSNGVMDKMQFHYSTSVFPTGDETLLGKTEKFWNPDISWPNKYKNGKKEDGSAFFLSTSALVFLTDGWHLFQFLMLTFFQLAILLPLTRLLNIKWYWVLIGVLPYKVAFSVGFTLMFSHVLAKRKTLNKT